jgi:hypothetical protein
MDAQVLIGVGALFISATTYVWSRVREAAIRRAELVKSYTDSFYASRELSELFLKIDYEGLKFSEALLNTRAEVQLIHFLDLLNSIALHYFNRVLGWQDISGTTLGYALVRTHEDEGVRKYLTRIDSWDAEHSGTGAAFRFFRELGDSLKRKPGSAFPVPSRRRAPWLR